MWIVGPERNARRRNRKAKSASRFCHTPHIDGQRIIAPIDGFDRHQDTHVRGDLQHELTD
jgi:hypothetical protein